MIRFVKSWIDARQQNKGIIPKHLIDLNGNNKTEMSLLSDATVDLGDSSKYDRMNFDNISGEGFHVHRDRQSQDDQYNIIQPPAANPPPCPDKVIG